MNFKDYITEKELPDSIKKSTRKEKISLLRRAGFTGIKGMNDKQLDDALLHVMDRIKKDF